LNLELSKSPDPDIIYYRWSQGDQNALRQFLLLEGTQKLETPALQLALATYYTYKDKDKTLALLKHALELYKKGDRIQPEIIQSLATISHQEGFTQNAYIWATVGSHFNLPVANKEKLAALYPMADSKREALDNSANKITNALKKGKFTADMMK